MTQEREATPLGRQWPTAGGRGPGAPGRHRPGARAASSGVLLGSSVGRNLGLVVALFILCLVGVATAGEQFASIDNALTILRLAVGDRRGLGRA